MTDILRVRQIYLSTILTKKAQKSGNSVIRHHKYKTWQPCHIGLKRDFLDHLHTCDTAPEPSPSPLRALPLLREPLPLPSESHPSPRIANPSKLGSLVPQR